MLLGAGTGHILQVVTSADGSVMVAGSLVVTDNANPPVVQGSANTGPALVATITTATTTAVVTGVASRLTRVDELTVFNNSATVVQTITVQRTDGTNTPKLITVTLLPGETLLYSAPGLWTHLDANGGVYGAAPKLDVCLAVASDVTNATTSFADITGLTYPVKSGKRYAFEAHLVHQTNATTTGSRFGVNGPATPTLLAASQISGETPGIAASNIAIGVATAYDTALSASTTGPGATNTLAIVSGLIQPSADGTFALRCASEVAVAGGLVIKAGSWMLLREIDA